MTKHLVKTTAGLLFCAGLLCSLSGNLRASLIDGLSGLLALESFESDTFPPAEWQKITEFDGVGWSRGQIGETVLGMELFGPVGNGANSGGDFFAYASWATGDADTNFTTDQPTGQWLITPRILQVEEGDSLKFYAKTFGKFSEQLDILVSTTNADSLQPFDTTLVSLQFDDNDNDAWQAYAVDLSGFAGDNIFIAFYEHIPGTFVQGDAILIDLVQVSSLVTTVSERSQRPSGFRLSQNYPNPFNPETRIIFALPEASAVSLKVYNVSGQEVADLAGKQVYAAGDNIVHFNASNLPNGIYYYKIQAGSFVDVRKMTLIK